MVKVDCCGRFQMRKRNEEACVCHGRGRVRSTGNLRLERSSRIPGQPAYRTVPPQQMKHGKTVALSESRNFSTTTLLLLRALGSPHGSCIGCEDSLLTSKQRWGGACFVTMISMCINGFKKKQSRGWVCFGKLQKKHHRNRVGGVSVSAVFTKQDRGWVCFGKLRK